jgi:hypothetical protein
MRAQNRAAQAYANFEAIKTVCAGLPRLQIGHENLSAQAYANSKGVKIVGDIPIYVGGQSADVWAYQRLFELDAAGQPIMVSGVPPDAFSETGQLWGSPLYDWKARAHAVAAPACVLTAPAALPRGCSLEMHTGLRKKGDLCLQHLMG